MFHKYEKFFSIFLLMFLCLAIHACGASMETRERGEKLSEIVRHYAVAWRWGQWHAVIGAHQKRDGEASKTIDIRMLDGIKVTHFELISVVLLPHQEGQTAEAAVFAEVDYYHAERATLKKMSLKQKWWYDEERELWLVETEFPEIDY